MGKRKKEELPDYTVANMDVDGMPWNSRRPWQIFPGDPSKSRKEFDVKVPEPGMENERFSESADDEGRKKRNHLAFAEGVTDCGTDLWKCGIFVYFILCIRVAEIKERLSEKKFILTYVILFRNNRILVPN